MTPERREQVLIAVECEAEPYGATAEWREDLAGLLRDSLRRIEELEDEVARLRKHTVSIDGLLQEMLGEEP